MERSDERLALLEAATYAPASPLCFTPLRLRARSDGWTETRQRRYVAALAETGSAAAAADLVGMTRQSARRLCHRPDAASFGAACAAAYAFAKIARRARAAAAREVSKGSAGNFALMQAQSSSRKEPSAETSGRRKRVLG